MAFSFKPTQAGFSQLSAALQGKGGSGGSGGMSALSSALKGSGEEEEDTFLKPADLSGVLAAPQEMPQQAPQQQSDPIAQLLAALGQSSGLTAQPQQMQQRQGPIMARRFGFGGAR